MAKNIFHDSIILLPSFQFCFESESVLTAYISLTDGLSTASLFKFKFFETKILKVLHFWSIIQKHEEFVKHPMDIPTILQQDKFGDGRRDGLFW